MAGANQDITAIETRTLRLEFDQTNRMWSIFGKTQEGSDRLISSAYAQLALRDGRVFNTNDRQTTLKVRQKSFKDPIGKGKALRVTTTQESIELTLIIAIYEGTKTLTVQLEVTNGSPNSLSCSELTTFNATEPGGIEFGDGKAIMNLNGYQSWSECDIFELDTNPQTSHWHTLIYSPKRQEAVFLGLVTNQSGENTIQVRRVSLEKNQYEMKTPSDIRSLPILPRKRVAFDKVLIRFEGPPLKNLEDYAGLLHRFSKGKREPSKKTKKAGSESPTGWCSWYYYYANVTEKDILNNLEFAAQHFRTKSLRYIQVDDGYQRAAGDWETNEKFPHGHRWLTDQIHRGGFLAGLWLAPFAVGAKSELFTNHPDWLLKNSDGSPMKIQSIENWGGDVYMLDPTIPRVQDWLIGLLRKVTKKWGYDYVKLDYLFFAASGAHYSVPITPAQAYQVGLRAIQKGVGSKKFILGCGAPLGISVGSVDGMRIGPDVEASWTGVLSAAAATAHRYFYHQRAWFNDPDCLVVREPLTLDQARTWASLVALSGQMNFFSDNLPKLSPERVDLLSKTLPAYHEGAIPLDLLQPSDVVGMTLRNEEGKEFHLAQFLHFSTGDTSEWKEPSFDDNEWKIVPIPLAWEDYEGCADYDGYGWFRLRFYLPPDWKPSKLVFFLGRVDDCDETYMNGTLIGSTGKMPPRYQTAWNLFRTYQIPAETINWKGENVIAVRVYDGGGRGGIYSLRKLHLPKIWTLPVRKKSGEWNVVGLFNWETYSERIMIPFEMLGLNRGQKYLAYELWQDEFLGEIEDAIEMELGPMASRVLSIHQSLGRPQVLSTSRHITHGAVDIEKVTWNAKSLILEGKSVNLVRGDYTLIVSVPTGYRFVKAATSVPYEASLHSPSLLKVLLKLGKDKPLAWKLHFER